MVRKKRQPKVRKVAVKESVAVRRVKYRLANTGKVLRKRYAKSQGHPRGDFYLVDEVRGECLRDAMTLEEVLEMFPVLKPWEEVRDA